jgi:hypothetical protein
MVAERPQACALFLADAPAFADAQAVDGALDVEQRVDALDRLKCDRRDPRRVAATSRIGGDVGQLEELPPGVIPAERRRDRPRMAGGIVSVL